MNRFFFGWAKAVFSEGREKRPQGSALAVVVALAGAIVLGLLAYFLALALGDRVQAWRTIIGVLVGVVWFLWQLVRGISGSSKAAATPRVTNVVPPLNEDEISESQEDLMRARR